MTRQEGVKTWRRRQRAMDSRAVALGMLESGDPIRVSNRTDATDRVVHYGIANRLVRQGYARYTDPNEIIRKAVVGEGRGHAEAAPAGD